MATPTGKKRASAVEETENNTSPDKRKMKKQKTGTAPAAGAGAGARAGAPAAAGAGAGAGAAKGKGKGDKKKAATAAAIAALTGGAAAAGQAQGQAQSLTKKQKKAQKAKAAAADAPAPKRAAAAAAAADDDGSDDDGLPAGAFDDGAELDQLQALQKSLDRVDAKYAVEKLKIEQKIAAEKQLTLAARAETIKGIAGFWKTALLGMDAIRAVLHPDVDAPVMDALTEVSVRPLSGAAGVGYTITFTFDQSAGTLPFTNTKLERTYTFVPISEQKPAAGAAAAAAAAADEADSDGDDEPVAPECRITCGRVQWRDASFGTAEGEDSFFREFFDGEKCKDDNSEDLIGNTIAEIFRNPLPAYVDGIDPDGDISEGDMDDGDDGAADEGDD